MYNFVVKTRLFTVINLLFLVIGLRLIQQNVNKTIVSKEIYWSKNDLKLIDPIDSLTQERCEILAVFMRKQFYEFEIRVDFLNENDIENCVLETKFLPSIHNEINFKIAPLSPDLGSPNLYSVIFNKKYQYILLKFPENYSKYNVEFTSREKNKISTSDSTQQINLLQPSPNPMQISLMAFNTHPGFIPSQILRFWNGAHTGPNGQRHGLKFLLDAVETTQLPVTLLDLITPSGLSALEFLDTSEKIKFLQSSSLLFLPVPINIYSTSFPDIYNSFQENSNNHGYINQNIIFYNLDQQILVKSDNYAQQINLSQEYNHIIFSTPITNREPFSTNGLSELTIKRIYNDYANSKIKTNILFSLNESIIADQVFAKEIFLSIKNHPWIEVVYPFQNKEDEGSPDFNPAESSISTVNIFPGETMEKILNSKGPFQNYLLGYVNDIHGRKQSIQFAELSKHYLPDIYYYLAANHWSINPEVKTSCDLDIDSDGKIECLITNQDYFGIIELDTGRLAFLAVRSENSVYQLIAPSSSIMFGLGPEQEWNINNSIFSDPQEIPGAFYDEDGIMKDYRLLEIYENYVLLFDKNTNNSKIYSINEDGFNFESIGNGNSSVVIPVLLSPECMRANQWQEQYKVSQINPELKININCLLETININFTQPLDFNISSFLESKKFMLLPENPEFSYPEAHYRKMGLTLVELRFQESERIKVTISK